MASAGGDGVGPHEAAGGGLVVHAAGAGTSALALASILSFAFFMASDSGACTCASGVVQCGGVQSKGAL